MGSGQSDLHIAAARIHITNRDQITVGVVKHQTAILLQRLSSRHRIDRCIIDCRDGERQRGTVCLTAT